MQIRKIDTTNRQDIRAFIQFPLQLYKGNSYFCPALESEIRFTLNRGKHPFYRHSQADYFLAESEGQVIGRVAAIHNTLHNQYRKVRTAFFWAFDVIDDLQVAEKLFEAVFSWASERGRDTILGPRGLIGSDASGVLVQGFDQQAVMGVPYNYPYYDDFISNLGFNKLTDHWSGYLPADIHLPRRIHEIATKIEERRGYQIKNFTTVDEMRAWAPRVLAVHEEAFSGSHEWHPNTPEEMNMVVEGLLAIADPRLIKLVLKDNKVIGFAFIYPDLSDAIRRQHGRMNLLAMLDLKREYRRTRWLIANGVGMLPVYQNLGGNAVLYSALWNTVQELGQYDHVDIVQVNEINFKSRSDMENLGVRWTKKHRSYSRKL